MSSKQKWFGNFVLEYQGDRFDYLLKNQLGLAILNKSVLVV